MPGRETSVILNGVLPTATLSNTQTSDTNSKRWKLLRIQRAHASHLWNLGAATGVQELRGRGVRATGYFKEPAQGDSEMQDYFQ